MNFKIIFEQGLQPKPEAHELKAAAIIAEYFCSDIIFLRRNINSTPDFKIKNAIWELKSPKGNSKRTIANNLRDASKQSKNVILDLSRCKMNTNSATSRTRDYLKTDTKIKKIIIITKTGNIIDSFLK